jgi:hypothetical protein
MSPYNSNMILHAFLYTTIMFTEVTSHKLRKNLLRHFRPRTSSSREGRGSGGGIN